MTDKDIQIVVDRELALLSFQVRRSVRQIDELLNPDFERSEPRDSYGLARKESSHPGRSGGSCRCLGCSDTPTERRPSQHTVAPAAPHTDTAPNTPPCLDPGSIQTCPTPRARPRATRAPMPRCTNQRHIRARPPTHFMHRIRRYPPTTPRTRAPGPKVQRARTKCWEIPRMSARARGGPPGVFGLLDHETQIRPRAHEKPPHIMDM